MTVRNVCPHAGVGRQGVNRRKEETMVRYEVWKDNGQGLWLFIGEGFTMTDYAHDYGNCDEGWKQLREDLAALFDDPDGYREWDGNQTWYPGIHDEVTDRTDSTLMAEGTIEEGWGR